MASLITFQVSTRQNPGLASTYVHRNIGSDKEIESRHDGVVILFSALGDVVGVVNE